MLPFLVLFATGLHRTLFSPALTPSGFESLRIKKKTPAFTDAFYMPPVGGCAESRVNSQRSGELP